MKSSLLASFRAVWGIQKEFRLKVFFLALSFFLLTACQAIWRPMKTAIFISMIGAKSIPDAKLLLMLPIIILIFIYSKLVDWLRRHHLFYAFIIFHGTGGIILYFFLSHPVYGIANTDQSASRAIGWIFYLFMESFGAFMSATFWSFANSINNPEDAKNYYGLFVTGSKIGGVTAATLVYLAATYSTIPDHILIPNCQLIGTLLLFAAGGAIYLLMKYVPGYHMHGYEAAYQIEKKRKKHAKPTVLSSFKQLTEGLTLIIKNPYVFGILSLIISYEVIIVIFDYLVALSVRGSAKQVLAFYASYFGIMHFIGLIIAFCGTAPIQRFLGIRLSLFACPIISSILITVSLIFPQAWFLFATLVLLRALNYGLNHPVREALFIPTTKAIKFKAKIWTDAFGARMSKASGSFLNKFILNGIVHTSTLFSLGISSIWIIVTYFLGKTYQSTISQNKVIGAEEEEEET